MVKFARRNPASESLGTSGAPYQPAMLAANAP